MAIGDFCANTARQAGVRKHQPPAVHLVRLRLDEITAHQTFDDAFDGGDVHRRQAAEKVLRAIADLGEPGQHGPLHRREIIAEALAEQRGVPLVDLAEHEADLLVEQVLLCRRAGVGGGRWTCRSTNGSVARRKGDVRGVAVPPQPLQLSYVLGAEAGDAEFAVRRLPDEIGDIAHEAAFRLDRRHRRCLGACALGLGSNSF